MLTRLSELAAEVRDRSRPAHGAFYSTISLPGLVYKTLDGKGLMGRYIIMIIHSSRVPYHMIIDII